MILTPEEMAKAEEALFASGAEAEPLMDRAGFGIAEAALQFYPRPGTAIAFVGDGHNGGDALVALRHLSAAGWGTGVRFANSRDTLRPLTGKKLEQLGEPDFDAGGEIPRRGELLLIDGLLGIGARGELRPAYRDAADVINGMRSEGGGRTLAVDIPSGVDGFTGEPYAGAVVADLTCTITYPKTGLLADAAVDHVGRLALVPLEDIVACEGDGDCKALLTTAAGLAPLAPPRRFDTHKGECGRVGVVAGSRGFTGAAVLAANAALRGGAGLVTLFAREDIYPILATAAPPEVMVKPVASLEEVMPFPLDAFAIGPGLGRADAETVLRILRDDPRPAVVDADALNILAGAEPGDLRDAAGPRLLTPHPGEIARLERAAGLDPAEGDRRARAERLAAHTGTTVLLKGARTVIAPADSRRPTCFNGTGNPGMATGGVGDTLSGLIAALAGGGLELGDAACLGSWINGRAAELAQRDAGHSEQSLAASDLPARYGAAFADLRRGAF